MEKPVVLVLEDESLCVQAWNALLEGSASIVWAKAIEEARTLFKSRNDWAVIVVDACIASSAPNTIEFIRGLRSRGVKIPIVGKSASSEFAVQLVNAGASMRAAPHEVPQIIMRIITESHGRQ